MRYFPISALDGDNIVDRSIRMPWYEGPPLLQFLEEIPLLNDINLTHPRFQVQYVIRPQVQELHDYRGYAGKVLSGVYKTGDPVTVLPAGISTRIAKLEVGGKETDEVFAPQSVVMQLEDDIDISRGDSIIHAAEQPEVTTSFEALLCWLDEKPLVKGNKYSLQHHARTVKAVIKDIFYKLDVNTLEQREVTSNIKLNEVVRVSIKTASALVVDAYEDLPANGSAILIDETSNSTVAAVMIQFERK